jgi:hypothetical protein
MAQIAQIGQNANEHQRSTIANMLAAELKRQGIQLDEVGTEYIIDTKQKLS